MTDAQKLREIEMAYETSDMANYDYGPWPDDLESYQDIVEEWSKSDDYVAVALKENQELVGFVSRSSKDRAEYELGYNFHPDARGAGYATEACRAVLSNLFEELGAERVTAGTAKVNLPSRKLLERLGFEFLEEETVAFRKDDEGNPISFTGLKFLLTRDSWESRKRCAR
jgi:ribosomal-protein-alanine N-acetyltransferase